MVSSLNLLDSGDFLLNASEDDMHRAILLKPELLEEGFKPISWEKKVEPGFVDIYGEDKNGKLVIVEVKRKTASKEAALQLANILNPSKPKLTERFVQCWLHLVWVRMCRGCWLRLGWSIRRWIQKSVLKCLRRQKPQSWSGSSNRNLIQSITVCVSQWLTLSTQ